MQLLNCLTFLLKQLIGREWKNILSFDKTITSITEPVIYKIEFWGFCKFHPLVGVRRQAWGYEKYPRRCAMPYILGLSGPESSLLPICRARR